MATCLQAPNIDWSLKLHFPDTLDLLSERDIQRYRLQRRLIGPLYQAANIEKHEKAVDAVLDRVIAQLRAFDGAEIDLKEWMHIIAVECLGAIVLTWSPGYLKDKTDWGSSAHSYRGWRRKSVLGLFPTVVKAELMSKNVGYAFARAWGLTYKAGKSLKPFFTVGQQYVAKLWCVATDHLLGRLSGLVPSHQCRVAIPAIQEETVQKDT